MTPTARPGGSEGRLGWPHFAERAGLRSQVSWPITPCSQYPPPTPACRTLCLHSWWLGHAGSQRIMGQFPIVGICSQASGASGSPVPEKAETSRSQPAHLAFPPLWLCGQPPNPSQRLCSHSSPPLSPSPLINSHHPQNPPPPIPPSPQSLHLPLLF